MTENRCICISQCYWWYIDIIETLRSHFKNEGNVTAILKVEGCSAISATNDIIDWVISSSAEFLWCSFCSGQRDKSCSHHFVLNVVSQTSQISLSQSSSVRTNPDNVLVLVTVSAFRM
ncbi:hypothetical protein T02_2747 [Trichinella nativa]|uniref:Uncharacterized protein n=1 Tax=Trichinella nativa TaxID=6335 RepID=A0A0V1KMR5_9BILA|nr:hypothetical protein T02_2747 [Trichinella nativa]